MVSGSRSSINKAFEDRKLPEPSHSAPADDRWTALRAYRKSKGPCFICGERWAREHHCKQEVQLHVVQEMLDYVQSMSSDVSDHH